MGVSGNQRGENFSIGAIHWKSNKNSGFAPKVEFVFSNNYLLKQIIRRITEGGVPNESY
jgi:hypothetical protein